MDAVHWTYERISDALWEHLAECKPLTTKVMRSSAISHALFHAPEGGPRFMLCLYQLHNLPYATAVLMSEWDLASFPVPGPTMVVDGTPADPRPSNPRLAGFPYDPDLELV